MQNKRIKFGCSTLMFVLLITASLFFGGCGEKVYNVGILSGLDFFAGSIDGFKVKMTELGYVEGKNIHYKIQKSNIDIVFYKNSVKKFVDDKVDLILTFPTEASLEAKTGAKGSNTSVVFTLAAIEDTGLVNSVQEPGDNITGVRFPTPEICLKRFEIFHELVPQAKRILVPYMSGYTIIPSQMKVLSPAVEALGITLIEAPAANAAELEAYLKSADKGIDGILLIVEPLSLIPDAFMVIGKYAAANKIPVGGGMMSAGEYSSMFGLVPDINASGKDAAILADKILKGAKAGSIPVMTPSNSLILNYKEIQRLGLNVSDNLLNQATQIIR